MQWASQVVLVAAAIAGVGLAIQRRAVHHRWWVAVLIGLAGFTFDGFFVPVGGVLLLVVALATPTRTEASERS